jgi:membrane associated rhomboid family serine protease
MGLNTGIFAYGSYLQLQAQQGFQEPALKFIRNMTLNLHDVFQQGKWWTMVTSVFMHTGLLHLGFNMLSTYYLGGMVATIPGMTPAGMLAIILGSGICGSIGFLAVRYNKVKDSRQYDHVRGLGFSGAVTGLGVVAAFVYPKAQMLLYGIVPAPLWALMLGFVAYDGYYMNDSNSKVAHSGHLGGAAFGALYFLMRMRGRF